MEQNLFPSLEYLPEQEVEEQGVEVDAVADRSRKQHQLAPQLGVVRVPDKQYIFFMNWVLIGLKQLRYQPNCCQITARSRQVVNDFLNYRDSVNGIFFCCEEVC